MRRIGGQLLAAMLLIALVSMMVVPIALTVADRAAYARLPEDVHQRLDAFSAPAPLLPRRGAGGAGPRRGGGPPGQRDASPFADDAASLALLVRDQRELRRNAVVIGALVALGVSAMLAILLSRSLARPIEAVSRAASKLAEGRLDARADLPRPDRAPQEVRALARDFDAMAATLERLENERQAMIADVAHELRNPLATLSLRLEAAADGLVALDDEEIATLRGQVELLTRLVNDLRTLSQADAGRLSLTPEALDLREPLREAAAAYRSSAERAGLHLALELPESPLLVEADRDRIRQVLHNLLENALRHTPEGGTVTLKAAPRTDDVVRVSVRDTGSGIHVDPPEAIFERFVHERPRDLHGEGGSGLGLAIVRSLVALNGGRVFARDHGDGAEVGFELPGGG